jgi:hypothetical protein
MSGWVLHRSETELPSPDGGSVKIRPGELYPFYTGTRFSITTSAFFMKSYGEQFRASGVPNGLREARGDYAGRQTGGIRIRWNGDTLARVEDGVVYLGKMTNLGQEIFEGVQLNRPLDVPTRALWAGPQSHNDIGERWIVPMSVNERPKLVRKGQDKSRSYTYGKHIDITDRRLQYNWRGGRIYVTFNGYVVAPIEYPLIQNRVDVNGDLRGLNKSHPASAKMITERIKRASPPQPPYIFVVLGKLGDDSPHFGIDGQGVQPDLSMAVFDEDQLAEKN